VSNAVQMHVNKRDVLVLVLTVFLKIVIIR
jgi:hypothetical protein